jgi:hypothetical protein
VNTDSTLQRSKTLTTQHLNRLLIFSTTYGCKNNDLLEEIWITLNIPCHEQKDGVTGKNIQQRGFAGRHRPNY